MINDDMIQLCLFFNRLNRTLFDWTRLISLYSPRWQSNYVWLPDESVFYQFDHYGEKLGKEIGALVSKKTKISKAHNFNLSLPKCCTLKRSLSLFICQVRLSNETLRLC